MNITAASLSEKTQEMIKQEISSVVGIESSEIVLFSVTYDLSSDTLNLKDVVRKALIKAIARSGGKISMASKSLGVTRKTLYSMIKKYDLESVVNIHE